MATKPMTRTQTVDTLKHLDLSTAKLFFENYELTVSVRRVTPEMAAHYLANARRNRALQRLHLAFLERQLRNNAWALTGQALIFDELGRLMDGQHRCTVAVKTGLSFLCLVVEGVPGTAFGKIDIGVKRTAANFLAMMGVKHAVAVSSVLPHLINHSRGSEWWNRPAYLSPEETADALENYPGLENSVALPRQVYDELAGQPRLWVVAYYLMQRIDAAMADDFMTKLATGVGLIPGDPELAVRRVMLRHQKDSTQPTPIDFAAYLVNAWGARRRNVPLQLLKGQILTARPGPFAK